ncbi:MAG: Na+/H+ antiporter subunit D [Acidobacteriota bacterium]|jgi:multicomponent Na+:H+ antiporter subunit D
MTTGWTVLLPLLAPLAAAAAGLLAWRAPRIQAAVGIVGAGVQLATGLVLLRQVLREGVLAVQLGSWPAPFGITFAADLLGAVMVVVTGVIGLAVTVYSLADIDPGRRAFAYFPLVQVLLAGVAGAFLTGDIFNLYVCFEVLLMASFVLLALGGERAQMAGALTYVTLNLVSSALFLAGVGLTYGITRSLNMAELHLRLSLIAESRPELVLALAGVFFVAFGIKAAVFPLYTWLPASYHTPPVAVSALLAGLLTKVGVYALIRVLTLVFPPLPGAGSFLLAVASLTMVFGVLGAVAMFETRRILSFHIVSQIGYMVMGLALVGSDSPAVRTAGLAAAVLYIVHHIIVKANLFLVSGIAARLGGSFQLSKVGGLATAAPWLALLFLIPAGSLAGVPPLSGFWAKLAVVRAGLAGAAWWTVAAALGAGLLTVLSMVKIWTEAFWKPAPDTATPPPPPSRWRLALLAAPSVGLAALTVAIGLYPRPLYELSRRAAEQLLAPSSYVAAVGVATANDSAGRGGEGEP